MRPLFLYCSWGVAATTSTSTSAPPKLISSDRTHGVPSFSLFSVTCLASLCRPLPWQQEETTDGWSTTGHLNLGPIALAYQMNCFPLPQLKLKRQMNCCTNRKVYKFIAAWSTPSPWSMWSCTYLLKSHHTVFDSGSSSRFHWVTDLQATSNWNAPNFSPERWQSQLQMEDEQTVKFRWRSFKGLFGTQEFTRPFPQKKKSLHHCWIGTAAPCPEWQDIPW